MAQQDEVCQCIHFINLSLIMVILLVFSEVLYKGRYLVLLSKEFGNSFFRVVLVVCTERLNFLFLLNVDRWRSYTFLL